MTINIRYDAPDDGPDIWGNRKSDLTNLLLKSHPDFVGTQEGLKHQLDFIDSQLMEYSMIGVGRDDGGEQGEYTAIFYDTTRYALIQQATFWLSDTPDLPSRGWDAALNRICTYGIFTHKLTKRNVFVLNTHYDHLGVEARKHSSHLIVEKVAQINSYNAPVVLMGDFNSLPGSKPIEVLTGALQDGKEISLSPLEGPVETYNGFRIDAELDRRIDYIFTRELEVLTYRHLDDRRANGRWISDHLPVYLEAVFPKGK